MPDETRAGSSPVLAAGSPRRAAPLASLLVRFPALETLPRVSLGHYPSPVQQVPDDAVLRILDGEGEAPRRSARTPLWIKREDLGAEPLGGNKVRPLELLLARVRPGDEVLTVGARGSTHALATAVHAARLGARTTVVRWRQTMNDDARRTERRVAREAHVIDALTPVDAMLVAMLIRARRRVHWIPAGGTCPLGILGHVDAALELVEQVRAGELQTPARVVLPLGTGGTAAGLALGFAIAELPATVVGVRVVPRVVGRRSRVLALARRTARLIEHATDAPIPRPLPERVRIVHDVYGGAYGRSTAAATRAAAAMRDALGIALDATYSAKAAAALRVADEAGPTLFWLTFDGRWMVPAARTESDDRAMR